jgi:hypothetical protein
MVSRSAVLTVCALVAASSAAHAQPLSPLEADPWSGKHVTAPPLPPNLAPLDADPWTGVASRASLRIGPAEQEDAPSLEESDSWRTVTPASRRGRGPLTLDQSDPWAQP